jgi:hypothetical protein
MANVRAGLRRALAICLVVGAAIGALSGLALLAAAVTGRDTPSSFLLGGFGFMLMVLAAAAVAAARRQWVRAKPGADSSAAPHLK